MATHFSKFKGLKPNVSHNVDLTQKYMQQMIVRQHVDKKDKMHPNIKKRWNEMT